MKIEASLRKVAVDARYDTKATIQKVHCPWSPDSPRDCPLGHPSSLNEGGSGTFKKAEMAAGKCKKQSNVSPLLIPSVALRKNSLHPQHPRNAWILLAIRKAANKLT